MKKTFFLLVAVAVIVSLTAVSHAAITYSGGIADDLNPTGSDPNTWDDTTVGYIGFGGDGTIDVTPTSTLLSDTAHIGYNVGVSGYVTVDGSGAVWTNASGINVGDYGIGTLDILNGGVVNTGSSIYIGAQSGSTGTMLVDAGSVDTGTGGLLVVGDYGTGDLTIQNGSNVTSYKGRIAYHVGSSGSTATVSNSTWTNASDFMVGVYDSGTLTIEAGGQVSNTSATIGYKGVSGGAVTGAVTVTGIGSEWNNSDLLYVGRSSYTTGNLTVENGGLVTCVGCRIANKDTASASIVVNGGTWNNSDYMHVGSYGTVALSITNGGIVNDTWAAAGRYSGANATITVSGTGSEWNTSGRLYIGHEGNASMTVGSGALVTAADGIRIGYDASSDGEVVVDGGTLQNDDDYIMIGTLSSSTGSLEIKNGGQVINAVQGIIGFDESAGGTVTVSGTGSLWSNDSLRVGQDTTGTLAISSGGAVTAADHIHIGQSANGNGTVTVTGSGSSMSTPGRLMVGNAGVGVLNINDGATVTTRNTHVNDDQSGISSGTINFTNGTLEPGTLFADVNNDLTGTGSVNANGLVANVAITFDNPNDLTATFTGVGTGGNVTINLDAGAAVPYSMGAGYTGTGSLTLSDEVVLMSTNGYLAYQSTATATATVTGNGTAWYVENDLNVGRYGAGTLDITDSGLVAVDGTLFIDRDVVDGTTGAVADSYVNMSDGGMLALLTDAPVGTLDLATLIEGDVTHIQWWNESVSDWASITTAILDTDYTLEYLTEGDLAGYALLTVGKTVRIPGDANNDGKVDGSDVTILANNWQLGVPSGGIAIWEQGDFNGDGMVDGSDVTILANNWQYGVTTAAASVPEPTIFVLLAGLSVVFAIPVFRRNQIANSK